jgi:hypothetical protein
MKIKTPALLLGAAALVFAMDNASAQSFSLDDNPSGPLTSPLYPGATGIGAEDEFGLRPAPQGPPLAPSPTLGASGGIDATMFMPPAVGSPSYTPAGVGYIDAFSTNKLPDYELPTQVRLYFSIDRFPDGVAGSAALAQSTANQAASDIFASTAVFTHPSALVGTLPGGSGYVGPLFTAGSAPTGSNTLFINEPALGLTTPPAIPTSGSHDNVDAFDFVGHLGVAGYPIDSYFAVNPDEAAFSGVSAADLFAIIAGGPGALPAAYATATQMGLDLQGLNTDSVDALIMFDANATPTSGAQQVEPGIDFALFSLAPGSASLTMAGVYENEIFFTDFQGTFGTYTIPGDVGLVPGAIPPPTGPYAGHNIDALDLVPEPSAGALVLGLAAFAMIMVGRMRRGS